MPRTMRVVPLATIALATAATVALGTPIAAATVEPGTPDKDVHVGLDNDNAANPFVQPPGVTATLHMDNTDVIFGRGGGDLLVGNLGSDTLLGGTGADILVGGPEHATSPNSDVLLGDQGDDVSIWAPGDGSDVFLGDDGTDTAIFAPFVTNTDGTLRLEHAGARQVPRVTIDRLPQFSCTIVNVPPTQQLGVEHLVRFNVNGSPVASVRLRAVEQVLCPSPTPGTALVADLRQADPQLHKVALADVTGLPGSIIAPAS
ncbi:MAG: hypothetical protein ACOYBY_03400 [Dermatophilaceae bacterium]